MQEERWDCEVLTAGKGKRDKRGESTPEEQRQGRGVGEPRQPQAEMAGGKLEKFGVGDGGMANRWLHVMKRGKHRYGNGMCHRRRKSCV